MGFSGCGKKFNVVDGIRSTRATPCWVIQGIVSTIIFDYFIQKGRLLHLQRSILKNDDNLFLDSRDKFCSRRMLSVAEMMIK